MCLNSSLTMLALFFQFEDDFPYTLGYRLPFEKFTLKSEKDTIGVPSVFVDEKKLTCKQSVIFFIHRRKNMQKYFIWVFSDMLRCHANVFALRVSYFSLFNWLSDSSLWHVNEIRVTQNNNNKNTESRHCSIIFYEIESWIQTIENNPSCCCPSHHLIYLYCMVI